MNIQDIKKSSARKKFTPEEDQRLLLIVEQCGPFNWEQISTFLGTRNARQCHDRWKFYINPKLNKTPFTHEEDFLLIHLVMKYGGMWVQISKHFHNRSDVQIKNRWKSLQKQMNLQMPDFSFLNNNNKNNNNNNINNSSASYSPYSSATYSPEVYEQPQQQQQQQTQIVTSECTHSVPAVTQEVKIHNIDYEDFDNIFGISLTTFETDLFFEM